MDFGIMRKRLGPIISIGASIIVPAPDIVSVPAASMVSRRATAPQCEAGRVLRPGLRSPDL